MTQACIGWFAEPECPIYGWTHGCRKDAPHGNTPHVCACGDWRRSLARDKSPSHVSPPPPGVRQQSEPGAAQTAPAPATATEERLT